MVDLLNAKDDGSISYGDVYRQLKGMPAGTPLTKENLVEMKRLMDLTASKNLEREDWNQYIGVPNGTTPYMDAKLKHLWRYGTDQAGDAADRLLGRIGLRGFGEYAANETPRSIAGNVKNYWGDKYNTYVAPRARQAMDTAGNWLKQKAKSYGSDLAVVGDDLKSRAKGLYGNVKGTLRDALNDLGRASDNIQTAAASKKPDTGGKQQA